MASINQRNGRLQVDFRFRGVRCREQTRMTDTPQNRRKLKSIIERMEAEILLKTFDYANYFPNSPKIDLFKAIERKVSQVQKSIPTFREFTEIWFVECAVGWRQSNKEVVRRNIDNHLTPRFGDCLLDEISRADVLEFRSELANKKKVTVGKGYYPPRLIESWDHFDQSSMRQPADTVFHRQFDTSSP